MIDFENLNYVGLYWDEGDLIAVLEDDSEVVFKNAYPISLEFGGLSVSTEETFLTINENYTN